jgi:hypothetical protein
MRWLSGLHGPTSYSRSDRCRPAGVSARPPWAHRQAAPEILATAGSDRRAGLGVTDALADWSATRCTCRRSSSRSCPGDQLSLDWVRPFQRWSSPMCSQKADNILMVR